MLARRHTHVDQNRGAKVVHCEYLQVVVHRTVPHKEEESGKRLCHPVRARHPSGTTLKCERMAARCGRRRRRSLFHVGLYMRNLAAALRGGSQEDQRQRLRDSGEEQERDRRDYVEKKEDGKENVVRDEETAEGARQLVFYMSCADLICSGTPAGPQPGHEEAG